jgi:hypothetical protein
LRTDGRDIVEGHFTAYVDLDFFPSDFSGRNAVLALYRKSGACSPVARGEMASKPPRMITVVRLPI